MYVHGTDFVSRGKHCIYNERVYSGERVLLTERLCLETKKINLSEGI